MEAIVWSAVLKNVCWYQSLYEYWSVFLQFLAIGSEITDMKLLEKCDACSVNQCVESL